MMSKYRVIVCDDEPRNRQGLCYSLARHKETIEIVAKAESIAQLKLLLQEQSAIDGLFLDINMEGAGETKQAGLDFAGYLNQLKLSPWIVFVSAYVSEHINDISMTFPLSVLSLPYLEQDFDKLIEYIKRRHQPKLIEPLLIHYGFVGHHAVAMVHPDNIVYISTQGGYLFIKLNNGKLLERIDGALRNYLDISPSFLQIQRASIVNMNYVQGYQSGTDGRQVNFYNYDDKLPIGDNYFDVFVEKLRIHQLRCV